MTSIQQRAELQRRIWQIANDVRGAVDGWDFKQYVLGALFYRFISENFIDYITGGDPEIDYVAMDDVDKSIAAAKEDAIKSKGYFIYPSQLFINVVAGANANESLNTELATIFAAIEASANGYPSEHDIKGLFADFDTTSNRLGNTVREKNARLAAVLKGVAELDFGHFDASHIDLFGDAYEFLISNYAANAGKSGGEFFTPQHVSKLIARLAMHKQASVNKIYDPACGSGSLLLQAKKHFDAHIIEDGFFGQEINHTTYNLARMNMFLHNVNYDKFNIQLGNTLEEPHFTDDGPFDAIVSNPPYSVKWIGNDDPTLINDERFAPAGVLAPKSKADFAFVLHALNYLSAKGRAAIVCFPGIFYRGGAEQKIRKYLVDNNYVETVISLAPNLFFGTTIAVNILVLSKHKVDTTTQFIDASGLFKKEINNNTLLDTHIQQIMAVFDSKENEEHFAHSVPFEQVVANDYNLSVSTYIKAKDKREVVEIVQLNADLEITVTKIDKLRAEINAIIDDLITEHCPDGVKFKRLGDIVRIKNGKDHKPLGDGKFPVYGSGGIMRFADTYAYDKPSVLIPRKGSLGNLFFVDVPFWNVDTIFYTEIDEVQIYPKFFYYFLTTVGLGEMNKAGGVPSQTQSVLNELKIPVPPLEVQNEILKVLDTFSKLQAELEAELEVELEARKKQYDHYRDLLLSFPKAEE